jgi:hypothetical protein
MRTFLDDDSRTWIAEPREQSTPRHHGRWYLVFRTPDGSTELAMTGSTLANSRKRATHPRYGI